ncbi:antitoxin VapB family protein [Candidatus Woesearchaeota archaeon]|nr:antitoxin VapB family protein [Candidatus Woesearchaeota archaeon]
MVKVISLSNKAYEELKALKQGHDSFSDVVIKLVEKKPKGNLMDFFGKWPGGKEELDKIAKILEEDRKKFKTRDYHELLS